MRVNAGYGPNTNYGFGVEVQKDGQGIDPMLDPRNMPPDHSMAQAPDREPDESFVAQLRLADPNLRVFWNNCIQRWVIWNMTARGEWVLVTPVQWPNGEYMELDNRILNVLYESDPGKHGGVREFARQVFNQLDRDEEARRQRSHERFDEAMALAKMATQIRVGYGKSPGDRAAMHSHGDPRQVPHNIM